MGKSFSTVLAVIVVVLGFVLAGSVFTVNETEQVMVKQFGKVEKIIREPGLNFKIPFIQDITYVDKRVLNVVTQREEVVTSDQKRLVVDSFARFQIEDPLLFFQSFGDLRLASSRVETILNSQLKQVLGSEILNKIVSGERSNLMNKIRDQVNAETEKRGISVVDVRIVRADLPQANSQKVFDRMRTQREQEAKEIRAEGAEIAQSTRARADRNRTVILAEAKRDAEIIRGDGDAEKNRIFADAFGKDKDFFAFYRSMQAYRESIANDDTTMVLSPDSEFFRYFDGNATRPDE
ncbi:MAG: hypothetical protein MI743_19180 [Sneathiellales bacterium]|nr:hypothetical protein [Sneathiellales bacterium]